MFGADVIGAELSVLDKSRADQGLFNSRTGARFISVGGWAVLQKTCDLALKKCPTLPPNYVT